MSPAALLRAAVLAALAPTGALAGEVSCFYEQGVVVVPASVAGLAGDYILDTGSATTLLHETKAQMEGLPMAGLRGRVLIAGLALPDQPIAVADLDARTHAFPTPIAGVIGADLLWPYVVDVDFAPCRVTIRGPGEAAPFHARASLPLGAGGKAASARVTVFDGQRAFGGDMTMATGSDAAVRLDDRVASVPGARDPDGLLPYGASRATLSALSLGGVLFKEAPAGLLRGGDPDLLGAVGPQILSRWRLRFDFPGRRLLLGQPAG